MPGINPTRLTFATPTDNTRTATKADPARRKNQDDPTEPNIADQMNEPGNPHGEQPELELTLPSRPISQMTRKPRKT